MSEGEELHASCVALEGRGVLLVGASGAGKSTLALRMIALGAELVADDRLTLRREGDRVIAAPPPAIAGLIEARGVGLLAAEHLASAPVRLAVDLDRDETDRLPPLRQIDLCGLTLPLFRRTNGPHFPAAILQYLKGGRCA